MGFCGNPMNHSPHAVEHPSGYSQFCEGVDREEVKETIVEKFDPTIKAEDGTAYSKVTIIVEHADGNTEVLECEKASAHMLEIETEKYVAMDHVTRDVNPEIRRTVFSFAPKKDEETGIAFTIKRMDKDGNPRA